MEIVVQKFGGTSVGSSFAIQNLYNRVIECDSDVKIVVSSAMSGVTDLLIKAANYAVNDFDQSNQIIDQIANIHIKAINELGLKSLGLLEDLNSKINEIRNILNGINYISELTPKILDKIQSYGELLSTFILNHYFLINSNKCNLIDSRNFIKTDSNFGEANVIWDLCKSEFSKFEIQPGIIYIFQGFIGSDSHGNSTTLGRGGSDYTASIIGSVLKMTGKNVKQIEIWTDVDGIMTADPRIDKDAETVKEISYGDVLNLSFFGAKVIHPNTVQPAVELNIPVIVRNTFNPKNSGTSILMNANNHQSVKVILKDAILIQLRHYNQKKLVEETNRILNLLIASGSLIYYQNISVYQSDLIFKESKINIDDYLSNSHYIIKKIDAYALIGNNNLIQNQYGNFIKGINDDIFLIIN